MAESHENHPILLSTERMIALYERMTAEEKNALADWERDELTGDGRVSTSDWPGWKSVVDKYSH